MNRLTLVETPMGTTEVTADTLHRGAKLFMDKGQAASHTEAMQLLQGFGLNVLVGPEILTSRDHQIALLTLVNCARRTLLGGVHVVGALDAPLLAPLADAPDLGSAVAELGGRLVAHHHRAWPLAVIGSPSGLASSVPSWRLTWDGWRAGVTPLAENHRLAERPSGGLAPALAAAICSAEAFFVHAGEHWLAGRRASGLSLWKPGANWLANDPREPAIEFLPSQLWFIGLGNLGQAFLWSLGCLEYGNRSDALFVLQDDDHVALSNDSTSLLSRLSMVGLKKTRALAPWLEARGFRTALVERRFGNWTRCAPHDPPVALCGVDNALARRHLECAGFGLVVEAGLGAGVQSFQNFSVHTFPSCLSAERLWGLSDHTSSSAAPTRAYEAHKYPHLDECGLHRLASRTVGVPFVGLTAALLAVSELLRRLHGGQALELLSGSVAVPEDIETSMIDADVFAFGHTPTARAAA